MGLMSCTHTELDPLSGKFTSPTLIDYTSNATIVAEKDGEGRRVFTLDMTDGTTPLHATLIGNKYFLTANTYTEAMDAVAKNGNFVLGKTSIGGKQVLQGTIDVSIVEEKETADGCENTYYIATILFLEDGTPYKTTWQGKLSFEADKVLAPELFYTDETAGAVDNTFTPVAGVTTHNLTLKNASGEAVAWFQLVLTEGVTDFSGEYVCKEYAHEDHTFGNGYDLSMYGMGLGGTRYVADDGNTVLVQPGETLSITSLGDGVYNIEGSTGYSFLTAPEGYVPGAGTVYSMTDETAGAVDSSFTPVEGVTTHNLTLKDAAGEAKVWFQLVLAEGETDFSGEYECKEYAHEDHTFGNGYDLSMYGMGLGGTRYVAEDGTTVLVQPGETLTVTKIADDTYKFEGSTDYSFVGKLVADTPGPEPQDNWDYTPGAAYNSAANLWKAVDAAHSLEWYYNPNWAGEKDAPEVSFKESTYKVTIPDACGMDWNAQLWIRPTSEFKLNPEKKYNFSAKVNASTDGNFYMKLYQKGVDGEFCFHIDPRVSLKAGEDYVVSFTEFTPLATPLDLLIDFSGHDANTTFYIKDITITEVGAEPAEPVALTEFLSLTDYHQYNMDMVGIELATAGFSYVAPDYQTVWTPSYPVDGQFIKLELYSSDGKIAPGTYVPSAANGTVAAGEFNLGADNGWGGFNGTSWFTVASGAATGVAVTDGTVTVSVSGNVYTIEIATSAVNAKYVGTLGPVELSEFLSLTDYHQYNMDMVGIELGTAGFSYVAPDYQTVWTPSYPVDGQFIKLELYSADGTVAPGTYVASAANGTVAAGEFNLGADNGWGGFNGTSWFTVASGAASGVAVTDGTVTVAKEGDVYTIVIKSTAVNAKYVGKLSKDAAPTGITIDGNFDDWADIEEFASEQTSRIRLWKFSSDAENVYFYFKLRGDRLGKVMHISFDTDNDASTGGDYGNTAGTEVGVTTYPVTEGTTTFVSGYDPVSKLGSEETANLVYCAGAMGSDSEGYVELSISRATLGLTTSGATIAVGCAYDWYVTGKQTVVLK